MTVETDVVIIGAGPAGLTAARRLSELDIPYTLISREDKPGAYKACGGYVPSRALEEFGLKEIPEAHDVKAIRMKFPGLEMKRVDFDGPVGVNVNRENLGTGLLNAIKGDIGEIWFETKCGQIQSTDDICTVWYTKENESGSISTNLVIDASGANPVSLRFSPVRARPMNSQIGYGVQYQVKTKGPLEIVNDFYYGSEFSPRGYAWNFPRGYETVLGTGGIVEKVRETEKRTIAYLDNLVENTDPTATELKDAGFEIVQREAALMPLAGIVSPSYGKRIMLAGDAACHCSPITGEGIHYSMIGGQKAAETAAECVQKRDFSDDALSRYERSWTKSFGSDLKWGLWLQKRFLESGSSSTGSTFLSSEKSTRVIAEMLAGVRSVRSAILAAAPGYLRSKIKRA
ncbi:MAG: NAD(P)/FAD-dependent oxidoreductase [Candidatus Thorarchaeota archaeon]|jgi:digeranylgeranylglycerophospholipid reductase